MGRHFLVGLVLWIIVLMLASCQKETPIIPSMSTSPPQSGGTPATSLIVSPQDEMSQPTYGGTLRLLAAGGPQMLGYAPEMGLSDWMSLYPVLERLIDYSNDRDQGPGWEPVLAERVDDDIANKRIIFRLRPGVKFQDGSSLNADAVIWNFQQLVETRTLSYLNYWKGIRKLDDLTVEIDYTEYTNRLLNWGFTQIHSKAAWEAASGGDLEKGKEWARSHVVGTGPFKVKEYKRDDRLIFVKNPNYWMPGKPYLDEIDDIIIPDAATAKTMMLAGDADSWLGAPVYTQKELVQKGFNGPLSWFGVPYCIWPNTADPASKWNDIRLRRAVEYALNKKAISDALGFGYFQPLNTIAPPGEWGYDPGYPARGYDPAKAGQLLSDAGYPNGLSARLLLSIDTVDIGVTLKQYLDAVGFRIELDVADPGRFWGTVLGPAPGPDLVLNGIATDITEYGSYMLNLSTYAVVPNSYQGHPVEQKTLDEEALKIPDIAGRKAITQRLVKYVTDNVVVIPVYWASGAFITASYVHPLQASNGGLRWHSEEVWMEKH